ncbi:MAG: GAF domain-containing protein [Ktedonobacteraceae bacterium]|nr:GAF domain-containing protein [Ktedonobacteraceae bacterium]
MSRIQTLQGVIGIIAQSVRDSSDLHAIAARTLDVLHTHLHTIIACIYTLDEQQQMYHLFQSRSSCGEASFVKNIGASPSASSPLFNFSELQRQPFLIEDAQKSKCWQQMFNRHSLKSEAVGSVISVPLWFANRCEGILTVCFSDVVQHDDSRLFLLQAIGTYLAAALSQARLTMIVESEQTRLYSILDQLPEGVLLAESVTGSISYANPAAAYLLQISLSQLKGLAVHQFTWQPAASEAKGVGESLPPWNFFFIQALSGEVVRSKEAMMITANGQKLVVLVSGAPFCVNYERRQGLTGAILIFQDITKAKDIEQQKNEFLSIASHELRTPITIIEGFAELLKPRLVEESSLNEMAQSALRNIIDQSEHLTRLIDAMFDITKIEQQRFSLHLVTHDLHQLLAQMVKSQRMITKRHQVLLKVEGLQEQEPLPGMFDKERMIQVISNLINNAIKYSPGGGTIEVGLRAVSDGVGSGSYREALIWVKDQGIGIAADEIPRIFERFHRTRMTKTASFSGFGIGLYVAKEIINRHHGRLWVESQLQVGSTFYIQMPLRAPYETAGAFPH